jgi:ribonuclease E
MIENNDNPAEQEKNNAVESEGAAEATSETRPKSRRRRPRRRKSRRDAIQQQPIENAGPDTGPAIVEPDVEAGVDASEEPAPSSSAIAAPDGEAGIAEESVVASEEPASSGSGKSRRRRRRSKKGRKTDAGELVAEQEPLPEEPRDRSIRILINARYADEKRVAILEGDILSDFYIQVSSREYLKGNIYKGVISSVMPGLQAVFVDFGPKRHGFLQFHDVMPEMYQSNEEEGGRAKRNVQNSLVKGQEILVQVTKDGHGVKGASLTTYISIPGRYVVMMPGQKKVGISRKIENREDRDRLKETFNSLNLPKDMGFILRTACSDSIEEELSRDLKYLTKLWDRVKADAAKAKAPALIYREQDIAMRTVRDYLNPEVVEILIDDPKTCVATKAFLKRIMPWRKVNVVQYKEKEPLFSLHNAEGQIARLSQRMVMLPSKGYLVFDKAEALTAIDVNSGRSRKEESVEATAFTTNLEAAREIARQLRLRDIGGLVVIDFIDMESGKNRKLIEDAMANAVCPDRASVEIAGLSKFCILEMTRERLRPAYAEAISNKCPLCDGSGAVGSDEFIAISAMRELHATAAGSNGPVLSITCRLPVVSANILLNTKRSELLRLEQEYDITISVIADPALPVGRYLLDTVKK